MAAGRFLNHKVGGVTPCAPRLNNAEAARRGLTRPTAPRSRAAVFLIVAAICLRLLCPASAHSQGSVPLWTNVPGGVAIAVDSSGSAFVSGGSGTIKYSGSGIPLWTNLPGGLAIVVNNKGNVFVAGTRAYSNNGVLLWTNYDRGQAIAVDCNDNVFVTGSSVGSGTSWDYETIQYSSAGRPLWTNRYDGAGESNQDYAHAMAVDSNGNVFVTGQSGSSGNAHDYATIGYSSDGVLLWTARYSGPGRYHSAQAIAVDGNGNVFVTGASTGSSGFNDYATIKYSGEGVPLWTNRYNGPANNDDSAVAIAVEGNGNVFVTGLSRSTSNFGSEDFLTLKYSNEGAQLWTRRYSGPPGNTIDVGRAIAVDRSGNVIVTGTSYQNETGDSVNQYATVAYSSAGVPLWTNRYGRAAGDVYVNVSAVALDNSGNVFVTGSPVTIKYSSSVPLPRLDFQKLNNALVLSWPNAGFTLQTAPAVTGPFTNLPAATSPYTNPLTAPRQFFRLAQ